MSLPQFASRAAGCLFRAPQGSKIGGPAKGLVKNGANTNRGIIARTRKVTRCGESPITVQKRYIALYRLTHTPWKHYELVSQPELAKECEERVLAAYARNEVEEAKMHFHRYRSIGVMPTTETWHKFLLMAYKDGDFLEIQSLFHTLISFGVQPDVNAWNFLLDVLSKRGLVRKTEETFWSAVRSTNGAVNEFSLRSFFNCMLQEKRYLRAMIVLAGLREFGYDIDAEVYQTLEQFCAKHVAERPGGLEPLNVPEVDLPIVQEAFLLDRITFGHSNVLACSDDLSPAGRDSVLTWYAKRATGLTPKQAFDFVFETSCFAWEYHMSSALGLDPLKLSVLRGWLQPGEVSFPGQVAALLDAELAQPPHAYAVASYQADEGLRHLIVSKSSSGTYQRTISDHDGKPISAEEASKFQALFASIKPIDFLRATL